MGLRFLQILIFGLFSDEGWGRIAAFPKTRERRNCSLTSAGTAFRDAIARREAAPSTRHRAEARYGALSSTRRSAKARTSEHKVGRSPRDRRSNPRSWGIPKGSQHVRNSVLSLVQKSPISKLKRNTKLRYVGQTHVACLLIMF